MKWDAILFLYRFVSRMINYSVHRMFSFGLFMIYCLEKFRGVFKVRYVTGSPSDLIAFTCTTWCHVLAVHFASFFSSKIFLFEKERWALYKLKATGTRKRYSLNPWTENLNSSLNILQVASLTYLPSIVYINLLLVSCPLLLFYIYIYIYIYIYSV